MAAKRRSGTSKLVVTNPDQVLFPGGKFTKQQVIEYYIKVSPFLLPHLRDRPVTLLRYPEGVYGEAFYEKDAPPSTPDWIATVPVPRHGGGGGSDIRYILLDDVAALAWAVNIGTLELHPFLHRARDLTKPTAIVFDLDPGEGADVFTCAEATLLLKELLDQLGLESLVKVSGSKGLQVYVPLNTSVTYEMTQPFALAVAQILEQQHPQLLVSEMAKDLRRGKVFIDWSQNADHKTTVGVYSLRAKDPRAFVSVPITWDELTAATRTKKKAALSFSPDATLQRLDQLGDLFAQMLTLKQRLPKQFVAAVSTRGKTKRPQRELEAYDAKRDFAQTGEPASDAPRRSRQGSRRRFVVQKHAASHLHYDFRLEMHDVLKSWAVLHGLPLQLDESRSGFETEDHPLAYLDFEGVIPAGEYGGGTVMVWDIGTYEVLEGNYWKGFLSLFLSGKKLKGEWSVRRIADSAEKTKWLITKTSAAAKKIAAAREGVSVLTGRTMQAIAAEKTATWHSH